MKKLTKTLSLVLVIAMVVSLCVVGASAKTFSDYKAPTTGTDYTEAIDVMSGIGIIEGMNGGFNAAGNFTRAQAAKIIAYMQLGVTKAEALSFNTNTAVIFKDVPTTYWAYNFIEYCAQQGIISGFGNGYFKPNDTLTGYQWSKMLLSAVGFGVNKEYNGVNWAINAARDGLKYGVFTAAVDATAGSTPLVITRDVATGMAFNTLTGIKRVTYAALIGDYIDGTGNVYSGYGKTLNGLNTDGTLAQSVFKLSAKYGRIDYLPGKAAFKVAVGTTYYDAPAATYDVYGYAAHVWTVGTKTITEKTYVDSTKVGTTMGAGDTLYGTKTGYMNPQSKSYVASADEEALVGVLTGTAVKSVDTAAAGGAAGYVSYLTNTASSAITKANVAFNEMGGVRRGVAVTLLDDDGDGDVDTYAVLNKEVLTLEAKPVTKTVDGVTYVKVVGAMSDFVAAAKVDGYTDLAASDTVLWFVDCTGTYHFAKAAEVTGAYKGYTATAGLRSYTIGDKSEPVSELYLTKDHSQYVGPTSTDEGTYYTDDFGYWCGSKTVITDNVLYVLGADWHNLTGLQAKVMFAKDGSVDTVTVSSIDGVANDATAEDANIGYAVQSQNEGWYTYELVSGKYVLTPVENSTLATMPAAMSFSGNYEMPVNNPYYIRNNAARFMTTDETPDDKTAYYTGNAATKIFVQKSDGTFTMLSGVANAPVSTVKGNFAFIAAFAASSEGYVSHAIIFYDKGNYMTKDLLTAAFYGMPAVKSSEAYDATTGIYTVPAVVNGAATTVKVAGDVYEEELVDNPGLYFNCITADGVVVELGTFATQNSFTDAGLPGCGTISQNGSVVMAGSVLSVDGTNVGGFYDANTKVFTVDNNNKLTEALDPSEVAELKDSAVMGYLKGAMVCVNYASANDDQITSVVIYSQSAAKVVDKAAFVSASSATVNGRTITGTGFNAPRFVWPGNAVIYTATVGGTQDANTSTALKATVDGDEAVVNNGAVQAEAGQTVRFYLADTSLTVAAPTFDPTAVNGLQISKVTVSPSKGITGTEVTYTITLIGDVSVGTTTNLSMTPGANSTADTQVALASAATTYEMTAVMTGAGNVGAAYFSLVNATPAPTPTP